MLVRRLSDLVKCTVQMQKNNIYVFLWLLNRSARRKEPKKILTAATEQNGSQVNFYYGAPTPYAESIAPSHHSTYAHYYDDEEDGWEMPNFYNETYMKGN